jgi:hypothetical protein
MLQVLHRLDNNTFLLRLYLNGNLNNGIVVKYDDTMTTTTTMGIIQIANRLVGPRQSLDAVARTMDQDVKMMMDMAIDNWCRGGEEEIQETARI